MKKTTPQKKKTAPKRPTPAGKGKKQNISSGQGGNRAALLLIIMGLLTVILLMTIHHKPDRKGTDALTGQSEIFRPDHPQEKNEKSDSDGKEASTEEKNIGKAKDIEEKGAEENQKGADKLKSVSSRIYLYRLNEKTSKLYMSAVGRRVSEKDKLKKTMEALISGATPAERKAGYLSAVPENLVVRGLRLVGGTLYLDFSSSIEYGAPGNIMSQRIDQIVYTATQYPEVKGVVISIDGKRKETIGSDGLSISGTLRRR